MKLTNYLIGFIVMTSVILLISVSLQNTTDYGVSPNITTLSKYNQSYQDLNLEVNKLKNKTMNSEGSWSIVDILGSIFHSGIIALKGVSSSVKVSSGLISNVGSDLNLGDGSSILISTIITILVILVFIGIILSVILNRRL